MFLGRRDSWARIGHHHVAQCGSRRNSGSARKRKGRGVKRKGFSAAVVEAVRCDRFGCVAAGSRTELTFPGLTVVSLLKAGLIPRQKTQELQ